MPERRPDIAKKLASMSNADLENDLRQSLKTAGERRHAAREAQRSASNELATAVRRAADGGVPLTEIAHLAGISRQAVYDILRD